METLQPILAEHPFFADLDPAYLELLVGCAKNVRFDADTYLFHDGEEANAFFLIRHGRVAIEVEAGGVPSVVATLEPGGILGLTWLIPPYVRQVSARAVTLTRAISLDGACLRRKCDADHDLGYELLKRLSREMEERLHGAWLRVADIYGSGAR
jgi:CRP/FNR family cyclic AMP-dependent transcriptional regulator